MSTVYSPAGGEGVGKKFKKNKTPLPPSRTHVWFLLIFKALKE